MKRPPESRTSLCEDCQSWKLESQEAKLIYESSSLDKKAVHCNLCRLVYRVANNLGLMNRQLVILTRVGSTFQDLHTGATALSVYADSDESTLSPSVTAQLGFPLLPDHGSKSQVLLFKEWLRVCDKYHDCMSRGVNETTAQRPTRAIEVGGMGNECLRLIDFTSEAGDYIALSHCWGRLEESQKFCLYKRNLQQLRQHIEYHHLPKTFQDAILITRLLDIQYLWIDSICIIQDDEMDWQAESVRMEDVFSSAYCVLSASSASSSIEGFLHQRKQRECVKIKTVSAGKVWVCESIDNFHSDVEESVLSSRGWVLQERALSRRSLYFTSSQVYWQCGNGVYCETLAKMSNPKAAFLGDSHFPRSALNYVKGVRILLFQHLYQMYSKLLFTNPKDRPIGISGLENRLMRTFKTKGGYGIFESYLGRGILWQRAKNSVLKRVNLTSYRRVPSWSWMAYSGAIDYMDVPLAGAEWTRDFENPFQCANSMELTVRARDVIINEKEVIIRSVLDEPFGYNLRNLRAVVIGKEKSPAVDGSRVHWVLLIKPSDQSNLTGTYQRVGVGSFLRSHLGDVTFKVTVC